MALSNFSVSHGTRSAFSSVMTYANVSDLNIGDIKFSCINSDHQNWLKCDGRTLNQTLYPALFNVIGTTFGDDGEGTFNLPDCTGRVLGAAGHGSGLTNRPIGTSLGEETHTLIISEIPGHTHTGTTNLGGSHIHGSNAVGSTIGLAIADGTNTVINTDNSSGELNVWTSPQALTINNTGSTHAHTFTTDSTGGGGAHNNMQPTLFIGYTYIYSGGMV